MNNNLFDEVGTELLDNCYNGFNSTIFAYGQTGSGKSYSIEGSATDIGLLQRIAEAIFIYKEASEAKGNECSLNCSYLEIYNEAIRDLLDPGDKALKIYSQKDNSIFVKGLAKIFAKDYKSMQKLLDNGKKLRVVGSTNMNKSSSRSHAVFCIYFSEKSVQDGRKKIINSKINIVDLAGSERSEKTGATGARLAEGSNINKSLTYLGTVIEKLAENMTKGTKHHIPYRNS